MLYTKIASSCNVVIAITKYQYKKRLHYIQCIIMVSIYTGEFFFDIIGLILTNTKYIKNQRFNTIVVAFIDKSIITLCTQIN